MEWLDAAKPLGAVLQNGWATASALAMLCGYLFRELRKAEAKLIDKLDKVEQLSDRVTSVMERLEAMAEAAPRRRSQS